MIYDIVYSSLNWFLVSGFGGVDDPMSFSRCRFGSPSTSRILQRNFEPEAF